MLFLTILFSGIFADQLFAQDSELVDRAVEQNDYSLEFPKKFPQDIKLQLLEDLSFLETLRGDGASPLFRKFFNNSPVLDGRAVLDFFLDRIERVGINNCGDNTGMAVACVEFFKDSRKIIIAKGFLKIIKTPSLIFRLGLLLHESRHSEANEGFWQHVSCPVPFKNEKNEDIVGFFSKRKLEGVPGCDNSAYGSYGVQFVFFKNIERFCTNCTVEEKEQAAFWAKDSLERIISVEAKKILLDDAQAF